MDVDDVMACSRAVLDRYAPSRIDIQRIALCGGSHGGFLTAHCTSQFPHFFKAAVMRNPVTNIAFMVTSTDIPDWCHAECMGTTLDFGAIYRGPTQEELNSMYEKSPISRVDKVQTPTLIALGLKDLRVPPMQGKEWYFTLRSRGIPTELLIYPEDNHSLSGTATEADHWIRIMEWFDQHL
jgi:acylaminoacyl-peptidase